MRLNFPKVSFFCHHFITVVLSEEMAQRETVPKRILKNIILIIDWGTNNDRGALTEKCRREIIR